MFDQSPTDTSIKLTANLIPTALIPSNWFHSPCYVQPFVNTSTSCKSLFSPFCFVISPAFFHDKCIHIAGKFHDYCFCHLSPPSTVALYYLYSLLHSCTTMIWINTHLSGFSCFFFVCFYLISHSLQIGIISRLLDIIITCDEFVCFSG